MCIYEIFPYEIRSLLIKNAFLGQAEKFCDRFATKQEIIEAGEKVMVLLFKGKPEQKLNALRFQKYKEKIATETSIVVAKRLPPTESATRFHSLRSFYQCQTWMQQSKGLNPLEYGWKETNNRLTPIFTSLPPAPESLLSAIRCGCKSNCNNQRCTCKVAGLQCTSACKNCDNKNCSNYISGEPDDDSESEPIDYLESNIFDYDF